MAKSFPAPGSFPSFKRDEEEEADEHDDAGEVDENEGWQGPNMGKTKKVEDMKASYPRAPPAVLALIAKIKARTRLGAPHEPALRACFSHFDPEDDGELTARQFMNALAARLPEERVSIVDAEELLRFFDADGSGTLSIDEFVRGMALGMSATGGGGGGSGGGGGGGGGDDDGGAQLAISTLTSFLRRTGSWDDTLSEKLRGILVRFDMEETGSLSLPEFEAAMRSICAPHERRLRGAALHNLRDVMKNFRAAFDYFDVDGSGELSVEELVAGVLEQDKKAAAAAAAGGGSGGCAAGGSSSNSRRSSRASMSDDERAAARAEGLMREMLRKCRAREKLMAALESYDTEEDGGLQFEQLLGAVANLLGVKQADASSELRDKCWALFAHIDGVGGKGEIQCSELVDQMLALHEGTPFAELGTRGGSRRGSSTASRRSSSSSSSRNSRRSSAARPPVAVDVPAAQVWAALKEYKQGVSLQEFDLQEFQRRMLVEHAAGATLNFATAQRVKMAADKLLGQELASEFEGLE